VVVREQQPTWNFATTESGIAHMNQGDITARIRAVARKGKVFDCSDIKLPKKQVQPRLIAMAKAGELKVIRKGTHGCQGKPATYQALDLCPQDRMLNVGRFPRKSP